MNIRLIFESKSSEVRTALPVVGVVKNLSDDELMDVVQRQTMRYFWENSHPLSGMARERAVQGSYTLYDCQETVTTGGTGFGIMSLLVGAKRNWLPRDEVRDHITKIVNFLEKAETHHGVFPHFIDARTGRADFFETIGEGEDKAAVSVTEKGGNLVETSFLFMGLLSARQYFSDNTVADAVLRSKINRLWKKVEWDSHLSADGKDLQWLNHPMAGLGNWPVTGWNEALITHILAAASPTHAVIPDVYSAGWSSGLDFYKNGNSYHGHVLPLGAPKGGPLFLSQYSFLGLDPQKLSDKNADYWTQNKNHTLINRAYCIENPNGHKGYGRHCWGLTASDNPDGYQIHKPDCGTPGITPTDDGTIAPTAALSAFPYTPDESMEVLRHLYEERGDELWTEYGFVDAFNPSKNWIAGSHLAIDQGPIVVMMENSRTGLLWNLFMSCPEIKHALDRLGFDSPHLERKKDNEPMLEPA